jgi:hypothetical protein
MSNFFLSTPVLYLFDLISPPGGGGCVDAWHGMAQQACKKELGTGDTLGRLA